MTVSLPVISSTPYTAYSYSYPHKTAYRILSQARSLREVWATEPQNSLFLYAHVPFCRFRCGFCNLFTMAHPGPDLPDRFIATLRREARIVRASLDHPRFSRIAIGGGTPTFLSVTQLASLFDALEHELGASIHAVPASIETSPDTITPDHARLMCDRGFNRISIGIQSFDEVEARDLGRPQSQKLAHNALSLLRNCGTPCLNIDLIYGGRGQTEESWLRTIDEALQYQPEEVFLYPLYIRPLTGLDTLNRSWDDQRLAAYRTGRDRLLEAGYEQVSMRMFRRPTTTGSSGPAYCCQSDGMIGLGVGARSYTSNLHYSSEYSVGRPGVRDIIEYYFASSDHQLAHAAYGFELDEQEQQRRYIVLSLLQAEGLDRGDFQNRFGVDPIDTFPEFRTLTAQSLLDIQDQLLRLTPDGLALSDAIGPMFYSQQVGHLSQEYEWR